MRNGVRIGVLAGCLMMTACSSISDGPQEAICGTTIGHAVSFLGDTWYVDDPAQNSTISLPDRSDAVTWLKVSRSCSAGATVTVSDPKVVRIGDVIRTSDGNDAAVMIAPVALGSADVVISLAGGADVVRFTVEKP